MSRILNQISNLGQLFRSGSTQPVYQKAFATGNQNNPFQSSQEENPFRQFTQGENNPFEKPRFLGYHNNRTIYVGGRLNINV